MDELNFSDFAPEAYLDENEWDPGFEGDRRVVIFQLGPFQSVFSRPPKFRKRFYHQVYDLPIEDWTLDWDIAILSGYCTLNSQLDLRFQSTVNYAEQNIERLPDINTHIKSNYETLLRDAIEKELLLAEDKDLILRGLEEVENRIETLINETLIQQGVQCRARCKLSPSFKETTNKNNVTPTAHFHHEQTVLQLMRRNDELQNQRNHEKYAQERKYEQSKIEHKKKLLEQSKHEIEVEKLKESLYTQRLKTEIEEDEKRASERQISKERLLNRELEHRSRLNQLELDAKIQEKKKHNKATGDIENYLQREIELLVLEKQQALLKKELDSILSTDSYLIKKQRSIAYEQNTSDDTSET